MIDRILSIQRQSWQKGQGIPLEALFREHPSVRDSEKEMLDLIYGEIILREEQGETPAPEEYIDQFPKLRDQIHRQFQIHRLTVCENRADESSISTNSGSTDLGKTPDSLASFPHPNIEGFDLIDVVGRGGAGVVYRALDSRTNRNVAIKILRSDNATFDDAIFREAETAAALNHPAIIDLFQVGEFEDVRFLVMELVTGGTLAERIGRKPMPIDEAMDLMLGIVPAIGHAHERGVIHRDIKPGNILMSENGPKIGDFGLASRLDSQHTVHATGEVLGTPAYMSPEQASGMKADSSADIYSLGVVLYEMLSGRPPFQSANAWEILLQVMSDDPVPLRRINAAIPRDVETICSKCLEKDPACRYETAEKLLEDLQRFREGREILARPVGHFSKLVRWCKRNLMLACLAALLLVSLIAGSSVSTYKWIENANNAKKATELAGSLNQSQIRLRDSVAQLHSRVFDESLYFQMRGDLRRDLYGDVVSYLDEFAYLPDANELDNDNGNELTNQYLQVAAAALRTTDYAEAKTAADRALERSRNLCDSSGKEIGKVWQQRSEAARILADVVLDNSSDRDKMLDFAGKALTFARRSVELAPGNIAFQLTEARAKWRLLRHSGSPDLEAIASLQQKLTQAQNKLPRSLDPEVMALKVEIQLLLCRTGQFLFENAESDKEFEERKNELETAINDVREYMRNCGMQNSESHCLKGQMLKHAARRQLREGMREEALDTIEQAEVFFDRAVKPAPNNRNWRRELINCQVVTAEILAETDAKLARGKINDVILNLIHLLEVDPNDIDSRKKVIRALIAYAEYSESLNEKGQAYRGFNTAANDCNFLLEVKEELEWSWNIKTYCWTKCILYADQQNRGEITNQIRLGLKHRKDRLGVDTGPAERAIEEGASLPRPAALDEPWESSE